MPANDHMNSKRQDLSVKCKTIFKDTSSSVDTRVRLYMRMSAFGLAHGATLHACCGHGWRDVTSFLLFCTLRT